MFGQKVTVHTCELEAITSGRMGLIMTKLEAPSSASEGRVVMVRHVSAPVSASTSGNTGDFFFLHLMKSTSMCVRSTIRGSGWPLPLGNTRSGVSHSYATSS